jgi:hypothetical protein
VGHSSRCVATFMLILRLKSLNPFTWVIIRIVSNSIRGDDIGSGILHLRATLPHIFDSNPPTNLFPPTIYSNSVSLSLPAPLPLKVSREAVH